VKRSPELTPLSRDHHKALTAARGLKRADDPGEAATAFVAFWDSHGRHHFQIEEEVLLPGWVDSDVDADRSMITRVLDEHLRIRVLARRLERRELNLDELKEMGHLLEEHVRFEERQLFPRIEERLDAESIATLGAQIAVAEASARAAN
jgi:hemerythrin-like domain-containing protein